jgi:hypothetical protein
MPKKKSVLAEARSWATRRKLFGTQAFLRYVIFRFAENLNQVSDDFVFKGGNLLWVYIDTPRATTDLDLATLKTNSHARVRETLERACARDLEIQYSVMSFKEIEQEGKSGAAVTLGYATDQGASNRFEVDIVYALETDTQEISSPVHAEIKIRSATVENIVADKLSACHRFRSGNSRMKDYDDLWRLSESESAIGGAKLAKLLKLKSVAGRLEVSWINPEMERAWLAHSSKYKDLPRDLSVLFEVVNGWLAQVLE